MASKKKAAGKKAMRKPAKATKRARPKKRAPVKVKARGVTRKPAKAVRARATRPSARSVPRPNPLRELAKRIVEVTITGDDAGVLDLYADSIESAEGARPPGLGLKALREKLEMWRGMVRDSSWQARNVCVDGNTIVIEWVGSVTFNTTGRRADFHEIAIHEIANGKIVRERFYYDPSFMQAAQPETSSTQPTV